MLPTVYARCTLAGITRCFHCRRLWQIAEADRTALGTTRSTNLRHRIKCVDRLLANPHLEKQRVEAYRALVHEWLSGLPQLLIVVDWSPVTDDMQWHLLRASVVVDGRSITLFEEVHPRKHLAAFKVHQKFVKQLAALGPVCQQQPIVITDAETRGQALPLA